MSKEGIAYSKHGQAVVLQCCHLSPFDRLWRRSLVSAYVIRTLDDGNSRIPLPEELLVDKYKDVDRKHGCAYRETV